jgi:hypothetical protein
VALSDRGPSGKPDRCHCDRFLDACPDVWSKSVEIGADWSLAAAEWLPIVIEACIIHADRDRRSFDPVEIDRFE